MPSPWRNLTVGLTSDNGLHLLQAPQNIILKTGRNKQKHHISFTYNCFLSFQRIQLMFCECWGCQRTRWGCPRRLDSAAAGRGRSSRTWPTKYRTIFSSVFPPSSFSLVMDPFSYSTKYDIASNPIQQSNVAGFPNISKSTQMCHFCEVFLSENELQNSLPHLIIDHCIFIFTQREAWMS